MSLLLADRIALRVEEIPDVVAVVDRRESLTYAEFWERVRSAAAAMTGMRRVAVLPTSDVGSLVSVTAAMASGVSVVLLHRHLLPEQFERVLEIARPAAVLADPSQHRRLRHLGCDKPITELTGCGGHAAAAATDELLVGITSGTTGEPKLFARSQLSWARTLDRSDAVFDIGRGDRVATPGVLDHTHFLYGALHGLTRGATVDLRPVVDIMDAVSDTPPSNTPPSNTPLTHLYSVPTIAWDVVHAAAGQVGSVREVLSSAARWPTTSRVALQSVFPNASLVHFYGASELSFVSYDRGTEPGAGTLFDGVDAEIRDGLVHVRSDMLFDGYLTGSGEQPLHAGPVEGWMTVGDRGTVDGRVLTLLGRAGDTLIRAGLNVELAPIEAAALAVDGVQQAACIALSDDRMGEVPALAVVLGAEQPSVAELRRHLRGTLPSPSMPTRILVVPELPRTPRGKLDRQALVATLATERTAPSTTNHSVSAPSE
ncbi:MAG: AMP-binding protein [Rhodococcus sp. (in: high G+C Gram-positive bacteria)]